MIVIAIPIHLWEDNFIMPTWKIPPRAKIYEALTAVADGRVKILDENHAEVVSSDQSKSYIVEWSADGKKISSNDNASYWQGYLGYPILAVLMMTNRIAYDTTIASHLKNIPWKRINTKFKNKYSEAIQSVMSELQKLGAPVDQIETEIDNISEIVGKLTLEHLPKSVPPPPK